MSDERLVLHGSFTSSSSYKPMLFLALAGLPFSFRTVNLKNGVQKEPAHLAINRYGLVPALRHRGLTIVQSNVILDYLARVTGKFEGASEQDRWLARPPRASPCGLRPPSTGCPRTPRPRTSRSARPGSSRCTARRRTWTGSSSNAATASSSARSATG